jgi:hypothetical protein
MTYVQRKTADVAYVRRRTHGIMSIREGQGGSAAIVAEPPAGWRIKPWTFEHKIHYVRYYKMIKIP